MTSKCVTKTCNSFVSIHPYQPHFECCITKTTYLWIQSPVKTLSSPHSFSLPSTRILSCNTPEHKQACTVLLHLNQEDIQLDGNVEKKRNHKEPPFYSFLSIQAPDESYSCINGRTTVGSLNNDIKVRPWLSAWLCGAHGSRISRQTYSQTWSSCKVQDNIVSVPYLCQVLCFLSWICLHCSMTKSLCLFQ